MSVVWSAGRGTREPVARRFPVSTSSRRTQRSWNQGMQISVSGWSTVLSFVAFLVPAIIFCGPREQRTFDPMSKSPAKTATTQADFTRSLQSLFVRQQNRGTPITETFRRKNVTKIKQCNTTCVKHADEKESAIISTSLAKK